jgi:hypothetical protein
MIFSAFQREDDDAVFTVAKNVSAGALVNGDVVVWDSSASADGVRVTLAAAATLSLFRGVCTEDIAVDQYGRFQVHGYNRATKVEGTAPIAVGDILKPVAAQKYLVFSAAGSGVDGFVYALEAYAVAAVATKKTLIRAL